MSSTTPGEPAASVDLPNLIRLLEFYHQTVTMSPMVVTITKYEDGSCAYVSPTFRDMTGHDPSHFTRDGMNWFVNHLHAEDRTRFKTSFSKEFLFLSELDSEEKLRYHFNLTTRFVHYNGDSIWMYYQCRPIGFDEQGRPNYSLNVLMDLTHLMKGQPPESVPGQHEYKRRYITRSHKDSMQWLFGSSSPLTAMETRVLRGFMKGLTGKELAERMKLSVNTINTHRKKIIRKSSAGNINQAIDMAVKNDWVK